jgi:lysyl-tRNA synthetase class 2
VNNLTDTSNDLLQQIHKNRRMLEDLGVDLFPAEAYDFTHELGQLQRYKPKSACLSDFNGEVIRIWGRIRSKRDMGKTVFANIWSDHAELQIYFSKNDISARTWAIQKCIDIGDIIGFEGRLFRTRMGELTLAVEGMTYLAKVTTPPPLGKVNSSGCSYQALADKGHLSRERRHVAFITTPKLADNMRARAGVMRAMRRVLEKNGFIEVQTAVISRFYGGAAAEPFRTFCNGNNSEMFLRVSPETDLKRLIVGGFNAVYEIGYLFRNEGIDRTHQPAFTSMECYKACADYNDMMKLVETIVEECAYEVRGEPFLYWRGNIIDVSKPWPRISMVASIAKAIDCSLDTLDETTLLNGLEETKCEIPEPANWGSLVATAFEELVEPNLPELCHVIDYPKEASPLAKSHRSDHRLVERFESYINGTELANAYSELNDGIEQRRRLEHQDTSREEAYGVDEYFLAAVDDGMPQCGGLGIGVDRLVMMVTDSDRIDEVVAFPV